MAKELSKREKKLVDLALAGGTDKELVIQDQINELEDKFDQTLVDLKNYVPDVSTILKSVKGKQGEPGEKGDTPSDKELINLIKPLIPPLIPAPLKGEPGKNYVLTERDKQEIVGKIEVPIVEKVIETTIVEKQPIVTNEIREVALADTPDEVTNKVNLGKPLIKRERVEGLADIERIAKANAFNPAMGPSFSDLRDIRQTVTDLTTTVTREGKFTINYIIDGGGSAITTGVKGFVEIPYAMTITGWQIFADQVGSIVIDVWKDTYANFPPTGADSIAGSEKPTLVSAQSNQDLSLSTWTTTAVAGDILAFNVDSISTVTRVTVSILGTKN